MCRQQRSCFIVAFKIIIAVFNLGDDPDTRIAGRDPVAETGNPVGMTEHLGGTGDDTGAHFPGGHEIHQTGSSLPAAVKVAADKSKTAGITDIRVGGDDGNLATLQLIDFVRDGCVVKRADHESINTFCLQLGDSLQLLLRRKPGLLFENGTVVAV